MIKITKDTINSPYFKTKGSVIANYPRYVTDPTKAKETFDEDIYKTNFYKIIAYQNHRDVLNLASITPNDQFGVSYLNIARNDLLSGMWWYNPSEDIYQEVDKLFDKFFNES